MGLEIALHCAPEVSFDSRSCLIRARAWPAASRAAHPAFAPDDSSITNGEPVAALSAIGTSGTGHYYPVRGGYQRAPDEAGCRSAGLPCSCATRPRRLTIRCVAHNSLGLSPAPELALNAASMRRPCS